MRSLFRPTFMSTLGFLAAFILAGCASETPEADRGVSITRDDWGIAHVHGKTDADAVFGMVYAQAEDDFNRIETNYLNSLGRMAEAEGEQALWKDLRQRLFIDPDTLKAGYAASPDWLRALMQAWADGLNHYLATHPEVRPRVLTRFEPWMALSFSEGSIGGDIEGVDLNRLRAFYDKPSLATAVLVDERKPAYEAPQGSNGFAIAPSRTRDGHALLMINPHTSFFFRSELQMSSDEGLNAYGAVTWGQFFIYQGFNEHAGWMHTSSGVDNIDYFAQTIVENEDGSLGYRYGGEVRPLVSKEVTLSFRREDGSLGQRSFTTYATHHGPIVHEEDGRWVAVALMNKPVAALEQSFLRTKAQDYDQFIEVAQRRANSSNNTLFADSKGNIAYLHPQFMPVRDDRFDYTQLVDGSDPATDWQGEHTLDTLPQAVNPKVGWAYNTNNWPWTAAGQDSPRAEDYPRYMDQAGENARGPHAVRLLTEAKVFTPDSLRELAYDSYLPAFAQMVPELLAAHDRQPESARAALAEPVAVLRAWDHRRGLDSVATSLAVYWGEALAERQRAAGQPVGPGRPAGDDQRLGALSDAVERLTEDFGTWQVAWGEVNRYQRNDGAVTQRFDDGKPSIGMPFASGRWGALATFEARPREGLKRRYGTSGNSFVSVVEFGPRLRAWAVSIGGESGDPASPHFSDQVELYAQGKLRPVHFYPQDLEQHTQRSYRVQRVPSPP